MIELLVERLMYVSFIVGTLMLVVLGFIGMIDVVTEINCRLEKYVDDFFVRVTIAIALFAWAMTIIVTLVEVIL